MNSINEFQDQVKQQKLDTKQYDVIYMKFKSRQIILWRWNQVFADGVGRDFLYLE